MSLWRILVLTPILLVAVKVAGTMDPDQAAINTIEKFCGNSSAVRTLDRCGTLFSLPVSYGNAVKRCAKKSIFASMESTMDYACQNKVEMGKCVIGSIPHESNTCINVDLTEKQIRDFNEEIRKANENS